MAVEIPIEYAIERLARRWGVPPWELEAPERAAWLHRGLLFARFDEQAAAKRRKPDA